LSLHLTPLPAGWLELLAAFSNLFAKKLRRPQTSGPVTSGFGMVFDRHIPILYSSSLPGAPLGIAHVAQPYRRAVLMVFFAWSAEKDSIVKRSRRAAILHRRVNPGHTLIFLCNSTREAQMLVDRGEVAIPINQNCLVSDHDFRPLAPRAVIYDAVYNARLAPFKRHELALDIASCAFIYYQTNDETRASDAALRRHHAAVAPGHVFVNRLKRGKPVRMSPEEVNEVYNQSAVGLCLSAREGAMFASMEYMLAGLPIVSTPSVGGRDVYFDDDYCIIARPDPRDIRDAVEALKARAIPREFIARRTLDKVECDRRRLVVLLEELRARAGRPTDSEASPFDCERRIEWRPWDEFLSQLSPQAFD
jgi:glycosyltransferase involved in cell wall biosynthesis